MGCTELYILPLIEDLSVLHINCRQSVVTSVSINGVGCNFSYQDSVRESLDLLKEGSVNNHPDLKRRWSMATAEDDEGELAIAIPKGMILPSLFTPHLIHEIQMDEDTINRASNVIDTVRETATPEPSTPQTPAAAPVLSSGVNFATLNVRIVFKLENPTAGVFFVGPDPINAPNPLPGATRLWLPCLDRLSERCTWDIDFIVPAFAPEEDLDEDVEGWSPDDYGDDEKVQVICSGDLLQQTRHPSVQTKTIFHYSIPVPTPAASISFVAGVFEVIKLKPQDYAIQEQGDDTETGERDDDEDDVAEKPSAAQIRGSIPDMFAFCPPGRASELRHTCAFMVKAMEFFMHEIGSYPFASFKMVFVEDAWAPTFTSASMAICSTSLLHPEDVIDQVYETRKLLTQALAQQWFGMHIVPKSWPDIWVIVGLTNFVSSLFLKRMFGNNEYRFRMKKDIERCCVIDKDRAPLYNPNIAYPIDQDDLDFIGLKAPLVLHMLDKRMSKGGSSLGLSRVIPKILVSVMSGELAHNAIGTHWFLKTCRKVSGLETKGFSDQWIYNSGCPIFFFSYHFNRKKMVVEINMRQSSTNGQVSDRSRAAMNTDHPPPTLFTGTMTARIHEADGTPYEHVLDIQDAGKRFEVQFNTKYKRIRRNTKRFQMKQAQAAQAAREAEEGGDIEDGLESLGFGAGLWEDEKEKDDWQVVEWGQGDETGAVSATFEWIRLDAEFEWLCQLRFEQPDFMWAAQLSKDRDVVAQYEAILALGSLPSPAASTSLLKTLLDTRCFFRVRMEAAYAIARCAIPQTEWVGLLHLTKTFQHKYCYPPTHATTFRLSDATIPCMPKPNDFSSLAEYYLQKVRQDIKVSMDERGYCPLKVRQFLLDLLRFNDNTGNVFSDNYYVSTLVSALGHSLIPDVTRGRGADDEDDEMFEHTDDQQGKEILEQAVREIDRYRTLDYLIPTYHNTVTVSCLQATARLMLAGVIPRDLKMYMMHTRFGNFSDVRLASFDALLLLGALDNYKASEYICNVIEQDPSPFIRFHVAQGLAEILGVFMARDGLEGHRELHDSLFEEDGSSGAKSLSSDKPALPALDIIRRQYGVQPVLRKEIWRILTSYPYLEHRILKYLLLFCDVLYPPGESILPKLKFRLSTTDDIMMRDPSPVFEQAPAPVPGYTASISNKPAGTPVHIVPSGSGALPRVSGETESVPIPAMAPELLAAVASSPMMQQSREQVQTPVPTPAPALAPTPAPAPAPTPKAPKSKPETTKAPKAPKPKPTAAPAYIPPPVPQVSKPIPMTPAPKVVTAPSPSLAPRIKEEPITSPTIPKHPVEPKPAATKPPAKKAEPKPKPPAPQPKLVTASSVVDKVPAPSLPVVQTMPKDHFRQCQKVLRKLGNNSSALHFRAPVDPIAENIPHYPEVIKHPMDLRTMKANLEGGRYASLQAFEADFRLMMSNCFLFNGVGSFVYTKGQELEEIFDDEWKEVMEIAGVKTPKGSSSSSSSMPATISMPSSYPPPQPRVTTSKPAPLLNDANPRSTASAPPPPLPKASKPSTPKPPVPVYTPPSVPLGVPSSSSSGTPTTSAHHKDKLSLTSSGQSVTPVSSSSSKIQSSGSSSSSSASKAADMAKAKRLLVRLQAVPCASEFKEPVDPILQGIPLYPKIITSPMDLGTIERKIDDKRYKNVREIKSDLDLVISNCRKFNARGCFVVDQSDLLEAEIEREWGSTFGDQVASGNDAGHASTTSTTNKVAPITVASSTSASSKSKSKASKVEVESKPPAKESPQPATTATRRPSATPKPKPVKAAEKVVEPPQEILQKHMDRILKKATGHKHSKPFLTPVDWKALNLPNYPVLIKNPMDYSTIGKKVKAGQYPNMDAFADDIRLVTQNCVNFNGLDHLFSQGGLMIVTMINKEVENAKKELHRLYPTSTSATAASTGSPAAGASAASKVKAGIAEELNGHRKIIDRLKGNGDFGVFAVPVDPIALGIPTYFDVIKHPMDFGTIEKKLIAGEYNSGEEVIQDVRLVFSNCATFNAPGDLVAAMGARLKKTWENMLKKEGLHNPKPAVASVRASPSHPTSSSSSKPKTESSPTPTSSAPKKSGTPGLASSSSKSKSAAAAAKMAPAYIPPSSPSSPHHNSNSNRRGSSTPAPTPLRKVTTAGASSSSSSSHNKHGGSLSANSTPASNSAAATFMASLAPPKHQPQHKGGSGSGGSKHSRHDLSSGSDLSDPDDDDDDASKSPSSGIQPIRLQPPQLMAPSSGSRHDSDSARKKKRERDHRAGSDDNDEDGEMSSSSHRRHRKEGSYSEGYASSSTSTRREHKYHPSSSGSSGIRLHLGGSGSRHDSDSGKKKKREREHYGVGSADEDEDGEQSNSSHKRRRREDSHSDDTGSHRDNREHREYREHREHKKHKKSRKHKKHKKRSSEDRDRDRDYGDRDRERGRDRERDRDRDRDRYYDEAGSGSDTGGRGGRSGRYDSDGGSDDGRKHYSPY
ncbi:hypothetical protein BGZ95_001952 [Linnemannia exigua]|uniref:Transcription initiation factor TFIID subunit 2 n=1 Tax=Linnemannia exigua TaxID=604196 RepID=A0AAD4DIP9_9FUNG|nr:hypothetical protein BGZ95_001952 [Linnemannia exigua]